MDVSVYNGTRGGSLKWIKRYPPFAGLKTAKSDSKYQQEDSSAPPDIRTESTQAGFRLRLGPIRRALS
jgi:hypothetical protein